MAKLLQGDWLKTSVWNGSPVFVKQVRLGDIDVRLAMYFMKSSDPDRVADSSWYISASEPLSLPSGWQACAHLARAWPSTEPGQNTEYHMTTMQWQILWAACKVDVSCTMVNLQEQIALLQAQLDALEDTSVQPDVASEGDTPIG